jgi:hypothetical protein
MTQSILQSVRRDRSTTRCSRCCCFRQPASRPQPIAAPAAGSHSADPCPVIVGPSAPSIGQQRSSGSRIALSGSHSSRSHPLDDGCSSHVDPATIVQLVRRSVISVRSVSSEMIYACPTALPPTRYVPWCGSLEVPSVVNVNHLVHRCAVGVV